MSFEAIVTYRDLGSEVVMTLVSMTVLTMSAVLNSVLTSVTRLMRGLVVVAVLEPVTVEVAVAPPSVSQLPSPQELGRVDVERMDVLSFWVLVVC